MFNFYKIIFLLFFFLSFSNLFASDKVVVEKTYNIGGQTELIEVTYSETEILLLVKANIINSEKGLVPTFLIYRFNYNFELIDIKPIKNITKDNSLYQFMPNKFFYKNDTLYFYGQFIDYNQFQYKFDYHLCVLKFVDNVEVFRNYDFVDAPGASNQYNNENLTFTNNDKNIYVGYKLKNIHIRKYDINGNFIKYYTFFDDSVSSGISGKIGETYISNLSKVGDNIYLFNSRIRDESGKTDNYANVYDEDFNLINEIKYKENANANEISNFEINNKNLIIYNESVRGASTIEDVSMGHLFELKDNDCHYLSSLGLNYPDKIYDIVPFRDGYISVGRHYQKTKPYRNSIIQKLDSNFKPIESFIINNDTSDGHTYLAKVKVLNEDEYMVAGYDIIGYNLYFAKLSTVLDVEDQIETHYELFPNPSGDYIQIKGVTKLEKYVIYDLLSNKIKEGNYIDKIDISTLTTGHYYVNINNKFLKFIKK